MKKTVLIIIMFLSIIQLHAQKKKIKKIKKTTLAKIATAPNISPFATLSANNNFIINTVCISPDGRQIISSGDDGEVRLWDIATQTQTASYAGDKNNKGITFAATAVAYNPDGKTYLSAQGGLSPKIWDAATGKVVKRINQIGAGVYSVAYNALGNQIAFGNYESITIYNLDLETQLKIPTTKTSEIIAIEFSPDSQSVIAVTNNQEISLWNVNNGSKIRNFDIHNYQNDVEFATDAAFTPDGTILVTVGFNKDPYQGIIKMWNPIDGTLIRAMTDEKSINCLSVSPDGKKIATGDFDKTVKIWEIASGKLLKILVGHKNYVKSVAFSLDNQTVLASSTYGTINLWKIN